MDSHMKNTKKRAIIIVIAFIVIFSIISGVYTNMVSLDGKQIAILGDSIMSGYGNDDHSFDYYLKDYIDGATFINNARGGSTITENTGDDEIVLVNQVKSLERNPDVIVLNGGANDIFGYALGFLDNSKKLEIGSIDKETKEVSNPNTVLGNLENVFKEIKAKFPSAKICFTSVLLIDEDTISNITKDESKKPDIRDRRDKFFEGVPILCEKYGVYFADLSDLFVGHNEIYRQPDWIHMTETGYKKVTPFLYEHLKKTLLGEYGDAS